MRLSVYVVDCANGVAATDVGVQLRARAEGGWRKVTCGQTGSDGLLSLWSGRPIDPGIYQLVFDLDQYYAVLGMVSLFPRAIVEFRVRDPNADLHLPLVTTSNSYSTFSADS
ncbi:hydroxyisourate hydrolase [Actinocrinis sp.]|jgi:5-hydroxyisourate hydrolase|uniref:hydroxyisourate hydrolase n=1 Tax=Actinocrinis sp. TaxID=1920516 RepID=UPI002DDDAFD8|nr:hydroxyisourate hydrolase [Actinocrinis sp.]